MGMFDYSDPEIALAAGLLSGRGNLGGIMGRSLMDAQRAYLATSEDKRRNKLAELQASQVQIELDKAAQQKKQQALLDQFRASIPAPTALGNVDWKSGQMGPTNDRVSQVGQIDPLQLLMHGAMKSGALSPIDYIKAQQKDDALTTVPAGATVLKGGKPIFSAPDKPKTPPEKWELYQLSGAPQKGIGFDEWNRANLKSGANNTSVRIDNKLGEGLAKEVGPMIADSAQAASGAQQQIMNADTIIKAVDSDRMLAGPGSTVRLKSLQIGQVLGVGGKDSAEVIGNTRSVIQGLARATLSARAALKGQGQVSDFEGRLLAKAESGEIDDMTGAEIKQLAQTNRRLASMLVEKHKSLLKKAKSNPATAGVADFFELPDNNSLDWGDLPGGR
jgi:hypothetical protein